jgi:predicted secreted protein
MATLKGQNVRICIYDTTAAKYKVIGMATSCTITLTNNTEESSTKDDVGMASKPTTTSKSWQVQVESLNVLDAGTMLTAIKNCTPFQLTWDKSDTSDNQTQESAQYARGGSAYISDLTLNFNDRENSAKSVQFIGSGSLAVGMVQSATVAAGSYTKGQFVRLFLGDDNTDTPAKVIGAAKTLSLHVSLQMEEATTKDTEGDWSIQEPTALNYDISTNALVDSGEVITSEVQANDLKSMQDLYEAGTPVKWQIANVSGDNNRTKGSVIASGSALLTHLTINAANRQTATYDAQLTGYGAYSVGS